MAKTNQRPAVLRDSWKKTNRPPSIERALKSLKLLAFTALGLLLMGCFIFLTFSPVLHPNTHVLLITGGQSQSHQLGPLNYSLDDLEQFSAIKPSVAIQSAELLENYIELKSAESVVEIKDQLDSIVLKSKDVLIIYVSAHCYVQDEKPYLCCDNFKIGPPNVGQILVDDFLDLVCKATTGTKLIILESGQHWPDARSGMVTNMLPSTLKSHINGRNKLWIMGACQDAQRSLYSMKDKHTNFGYFVAQGLQGAADFNQNQIINLQELYEYVHTNVRAASELNSRDPLQTPFLISGMEAQLSNDPILLSVTPLLDKNDNAKNQSSTKQTVATSEAVAASPAAQKPKSTPSEAKQPNPAKDTNPKDAPATSNDAAVSKKTESLLTINLKKSGESQKARSQIWGQTYQQSAKLLKQAWTLYFEFESSEFAYYRPLDYAPVAWRELGDLIMRYDRQIRQGREAIEARERLTEIIEALTALKNDSPIPDSANFGVIDRIVASQPPSLFRSNEIHSMGYWQQLESTGLAKPNTELSKKIAEFDLALKSETSELLIKWLNQHQDLAGLHDVWLANKLLAIPNLDWPTQSLCLSVTHLSEQTGTPYVSQFPSIRERLNLADRARIQAISLLQDQVESEWLPRAKAGLAESAKFYTQINNDIRVVNQAYHLRNDLVKRLIYLKRLGFINASGTNNTFYERVEKLVDAVSRLNSQLKPSNETDIPSLQWSIKNSANIYQSLCNLLFLNAAQTDAPFAIGQADFNTLLSAPIFKPETRSAILLQLNSRPNFKSIAPNGNVIPAANFKIDPNASSQLQYTLENKILNLRTILNDPRSDESDVNQKLKLSIEKAPIHPLKTDRLLAEIYQDMFKQIQQELKTQATNQQETHHTNQLREIWFNYQLVDHRDLPPPPKLINSMPVYRDAGFRSLELARSRMSTAIQNQTPADRQFLASIRNSYLLKMQQFENIGEMKFDELALIQFRGTQEANLTGGQSRQVNISYQLTTAEMENVSIYLDYNPKSITVKELNNLQSATDMADLRASKPTLFSPLDLAVGEAKKTSPGEKNTISLLLSPLVQGPDSKLIITAVVNGQAVRHVINATLSNQSDWQITLEPRDAEIAYTKANLIELLPLPNRKSDFEFFLKNKSGRTSKVKLTLIAPQNKLTASIPSGVISASKLQNFKDSIGAFITLHETPVWISAPSTTPLPIPMLPVKKKEGVAEPAKKPTTPESTNVRHGILAVLSDADTGNSQIWHLDFRPQKPMRFLNLSAGYNAARERVEIKVKSNAAELIPSDGHEIICEFLRPLPLRSQARLQGKITPQNPEINLYAEVTSSKGRFETVNVNVDNYPRAFTLEIPCWEDIQQIAPSRNTTDIEIKKPLRYQSFKAPTQSIPVEFKVDTPINAFDQPNSVVEIGIDANRDRVLNNGEKSVKFYSDRQAELAFLGLDEDGKIRIENQVGDFQINLNGTGYRNAKVNILGRIQTDSKIEWSNSVEIRLDSKPPEIKRSILDPGNLVARDSKFSVRVFAEDDEMSGVKAVTIQFANKDGELDKKLPTVVAKKQDDLSWLGEISLDDLPDGSNELLISATDGVGNQSQFSRQTFKVVTAKMMAEEKQRQRFNLQGRVYYQNAVRPGAKVQLIDEKGKTLVTTCNEEGTFEFQELPSGKYSLKARAVVRNTPRLFQNEVELGPDKPSIKSLVIDLD